MYCEYQQMSDYAKEMRKDAVVQSQRAFKEDKTRIFLAISTVYKVAEYARKEGILSLSRESMFREGRKHVLSIIEEEKNIEIPLKLYLELGLTHVAMGNEVEVVEELMANRYFANGYVGADAIIGFIYLLAVTWIQQGICFEHLQDYFISIIPNWMEEEMNTFFANMQLE